ncbi:MAG: hypothetical protein QOK27_2087 [Gemmatimonadales bacterium]|jgi:uncharacterized membrane protein|nr:hypothetical protein [Gemmatimonadales bacterium]
MIYRMSAAFLSLAGLFISGYLYLYKIGRIGSLACGTGGCETVQLSPWSRFAGLEVSLIGVFGYAGLLAMSLASLQPGARQWPIRAIAVAAGVGVVFTLYLTYLELFIIHAVCRWCVASGVIIVAIFVAALLDQRRQPRTRVS